MSVARSPDTCFRSRFLTELHERRKARKSAASPNASEATPAICAPVRKSQSASWCAGSSKMGPLRAEPLAHHE